MYYSNGTPSATYSYDSGINGVGQLTTISNQVSTTNFTTFDAMGRVTASNQQTNGQTYAFGYTYDLAGELKTETYPSNRVVSTTYDTMGRPISLNGSYQNQSTGYVTNMKYWANGGINSMTRGNALVHAETYNNRLQLTGVTEKGNNGNLLTLGLTWGASATTNNGLLGTATATGGGISLTQTFGYDILNRLTSASEANSAQTWQQTYQYDQYGNMWMPPSTPALPAPAIGPGAPTANVYNPVSNRNTNSGYDNAGNLSTFGSQSATFDAENRLLTVGSETYFYDGVGQRVGKSGPAASIMYVYDAFGQLASEYNLSTNPAVPSCVTCYVAGDHLGSLRLVTDGSQNANVVARHDFTPFGQEIPAGVGSRTSVWGATDNVSQRFTGQVRDSEVALDFFNARYLSSGLGRFMSADPANAGMDFTNPQSMNGYGYVLGNPLGLVDPSGLGPTKIVPGNIGSVGPQGPNCFMDGLSTTCGLAADLVASGAAALCPNNVCSAFGTSSGGQIQYYQFSSYANGMTGYIPINSTPYEIQENVLGTVYTSDGIFLCCGPEASSLPPLNWLSLSYTTSGGASIQFNKTCVGDRGHGLAGNPSYVQQTPQGGAFAPWGVHPTAGTAAVIPSQWGYSNNVAMHGVISQISGTVGGNQFSSITDVIGSKVRPGVRDFFSRQAGGQLVIEIPGGRDTGPNAAVSVTVPAFPAGLPTANGCPSHTD